MSFVADAFDEGFAIVIRRSVREVVEGVLAKVPGGSERRQNIREAAERFGTALVAYAEAAEPSGSVPRTPTNTRTSPPRYDDSDRHARAFRIMTGVRQ